MRTAETALPGASVEERIWKYWMPRIASVVLAIGVAWALYYIGPHTPNWLRVAFGYAVSAALIGVGWALEKKYLQYARVLYATAIGVSYFVSFAAHYIAAARIIESENAGIALLIAVVATWGVVAQVRQSRIVATLVTMLGHLTMALAFFTTGELAKYSIAGVAVLGVGSAFFLLYNRWYYVAVIGLVGCYLNHTLWTLHFLDAHPIPSFQLSFGFLWVYMLTFALAELFCSEDLRRSIVPTQFRALFVSANTAAFFTIATFTLMRYDHMWAHRDDFLLAYAIVLGLIALGYLRLRQADPLYNAYFVKSVSAATLFLAARYGQGTLTASLAVETVVLLYSSRRSGLVVTRVLALGAAVLCVWQGLYTIVNSHQVPYSDPLYWRRIVEACFAAGGMFVASQLYQRTDWSVRAPQTLRLPRVTLDTLWDNDLVGLPGTPGRSKPFGGLQFPFIYATAGTLLYMAYITIFAVPHHHKPWFAGFVLAMTLAAFALRARPFGLVAMLGLVPTAVSVVLDFSYSSEFPRWMVWITVAMVGAAAAFSDRRIIGAREGLAFHQMAASPYFLYCTAALCVLFHTGESVRSAVWLAIAAAATTVHITVLHRRAVATAAVMLIAFSVLKWLSVHQQIALGPWHGSALLILAVCVFSNRFFARGGGRDALPQWAAAVLLLSWPVVFQYCFALAKNAEWFAAKKDFLDAVANNPESIAQIVLPPGGYVGFGYFDEDWLPLVLALVAFAYGAYGGLLRSRTAIAIAAAHALIVSALLVTASYESHKRLATLPLVCGYVSVAVFWGLCERLVAPIKTQKYKDIIDPLCGACVGAASLLLVLMVERVPSLSKYFLTIGWGVLALGLFGVSLAVGQRFYRYAGLGVFMLAIARLFYDARDLEGIYRPLAFIGLAVLMLIVSFGYYYASRIIDAREASANGKPGRKDEQPPDIPPPAT